jgi:hypothetical protein
MVSINVLNREHQKIKIMLQDQEKTGMVQLISGITAASSGNYQTKTDQDSEKYDNS